MKNWIIARNAENGYIQLISRETYEKAEGLFEAIDETDSEYKARVKMKEIKAMGLNRYLETTISHLLKAQGE